MGPTASGKSDLALRLAADIGGSILSADSMQVYREMNIGTAKPSADQQAAVTHHMIDLVDPDETFTVAQFQDRGRSVVHAAVSPIIVVGGSGLHVRALLDPMTFPPHDATVRDTINALDPAEALRRLEIADPGAAARVDVKNPRRVQRALEVYQLTGLTPSARADLPEARALADYVPAMPFVAFGVDPGDGLAQRVQARICDMVESGLVAEVAGLKGRLGSTARTATGYPEFGRHVDGEISVDEAKSLTANATMSLAKRQRTFFGRDPRINWIDWDEDPSVRYHTLRSQLDRVMG